jgi:hypothetical protein
VSAPDRTSGPYIVWQNYGCEGWQPDSYLTLDEAIRAHRYQSKWVVTKAVEFVVLDGESELGQRAILDRERSQEVSIDRKSGLSEGGE